MLLLLLLPFAGEAQRAGKPALAASQYQMKEYTLDNPVAGEPDPEEAVKKSFPADNASVVAAVKFLLIAIFVFATALQMQD